MGTEGFRRIFRNHVFPCSGGKCLLPEQRQTFLYSESRRIVFRENDCSHTCRMLGGRSLLSPACWVYVVGALEGGGDKQAVLLGTLCCTYLYILTLSPCTDADFLIFTWFCFLPDWPTMRDCFALEKKKNKNNMLVIFPPIIHFR